MRKILTKQFFPMYLYKLRKIELCQVVEGTLLLRENFFNCALKRVFFKNYEQRFRKFSKFSIIFLHKMVHTLQTTPPMPLIFFTGNATLNLPRCGINYTSVLFLVLKPECFENYSKFFENKKFERL